MTLARFPRRTLRGDAELYRIHRRATDAWWFSSDGAGRFDPIGTGHGACYMATQPLGAWIEVFRQEMLLSEVAITPRVLCTIQLGRDVRLADLTSRRVLQFGVSASLGANEEYSASQAFAATALEAGFAGIRYWLRHDPAQRLYAIALFGDAGASTPERAAAVEHEIAEALLDQAQAAFGYRILPTP